MYYFAYGSNMVASQMAARCPNASVIGVACLKGYRFRINSRRVGTVIPDQPHQVYGLLWNITPQNLRALDRYEDVKAGLYEKATFVVNLLSDRQVEALIYLATDQAIGLPRPRYMKDVLAAAKQWQLPQAYIQELALWLATDG
ncbi:MAG TPA: gamma-glutamylcyclotransferase family protein [Candidatus Binatia bacterium]